MNITWFKKDRQPSRKSDADITINVTTKAAYITVRNNLIDEISPDTNCVLLGIDRSDKNRLVFMASDSRTGYKFYRCNDKVVASIKRCAIYSERMRTMLARFSGDYNLDLYEDTGTILYCIDRRNVL